MELVRLAGKDFWKRLKDVVGESGGCYMLHCLDPDSQSVVPVPRALGTDTEGVLYVGQSNRLLGRVTTLKKELSPAHRGRQHVCGRRYKNAQHATLRRAFPYDRLCVSVTVVADPKRVERSRLAKYCETFGEGPPLNSIE